MSDYSLKGEEDRCEEDCRENCLAGPLWAEELEHGGRRDGVVDEEALRCGLNKDKSRVAEQAASTDEEEKKRACLEEWVQEQVLLLRVGD